MIHMTTEERLLSKRKIMPNGCWLWTGTCHKRGHGLLKIAGKFKYVHRLAAELWHPDFDRKAIYCHKNNICKHKACFNPSHVYKGTQYQNVQDSIAAGNHFTFGKIRNTKQGA